MNQENPNSIDFPLLLLLVLVAVVLLFGILWGFSSPRTVNFSYVSVKTPDTALVYRLILKQEATTKTQFGLRIQAK